LQLKSERAKLKMPNSATVHIWDKLKVSTVKPAVIEDKN
jgi:hypothetical protein